MARYQSNGTLLRAALLANSLFSLACAAACLFQSEAVAALLFTQSTVAFGLPGGAVVMALGVGLLLFSVIVAVTGVGQPIATRAAGAITIADVMWVVSSIALLVVAGGVFTSGGKWIVELVALAVFLFGLGQAIGLAVLYQGESKISITRDGRSRHVEVTRRINASAKTAWEVVTDHEAYSDVADNISKVEVLEGDSEGMRRKCTGNEGETWTEVAHIWEEGRRYGFRIDTDAPDYPYPLEKLEATWTVDAVGPDECDVTIAFDVTPLQTFKGALFISVSMIMFPKLLDRLLGRWGARMEALEA